MSSILNDKRTYNLIRKHISIPLVDVDPDSDAASELFLFDEMPIDMSKVTPELLLRLPSVYGLVLWLRENARADVVSLFRARKNERAVLSNNCLNPIGDSRPISKTTERAVDAYVESQPSIVELNAKYEQAKSELEHLNAVCDAVKNYNINLNTYFRVMMSDENQAPPLPKATIKL